MVKFWRWGKPKEVTTDRAEQAATSRLRRLLIKEKTLEERIAGLARLEERAKFGLRISQPSFVYSAPPLSRMEGHLVTGHSISGYSFTKTDIFPDTKYPITWTPPETWRSMFGPIIRKETEKLEIVIPIGITRSGGGYVKGHRIAAGIPTPILDLPYGLSRIGIIGHRSFTVSAVSPDFDTRLAYTQRALTLVKTLRHVDQTAFSDVIDLVKKKSDIEKAAFLRDYWEYLAGGEGGEPEKLVRKIVEAATKRGEELPR